MVADKQTERVLNYMRTTGPINPMVALQKLGIFRLASRITDLKQQGHIIHKEMVSVRNRFNEVTRVAQYSLGAKSR